MVEVVLGNRGLVSITSLKVFLQFVDLIHGFLGGRLGEGLGGREGGMDGGRGE